MQLVTLGLVGETYGLEIDIIQEIIMDREPTRVPNLPSFLKGIINLRDNVIPIVEGTERIGYEEDESPPQGEAKIFIVKYKGQLIGIRVESALNVIEVDREDVQSSPDIIEEMGGEFVKGIVHFDMDSDESSRGETQERRSGSAEVQADIEGASGRATGRRQENQQERDLTNVMILDLDALFTGEEISQIKQAKEEI